MGGCPDPDLESHRRDDRVYQRERRALKKYLPKLVDHLGEMRKLAQIYLLHTRAIVRVSYVRLTAQLFLLRPPWRE